MASPRLRVAAAALLCLLVQARGQCEVPLAVQPQDSTLALGGGALGQQLTPAPPDAVLGLQGSAAVVSSTQACPADTAALVQQLDGTTLQTTSQLGPLQVYPAVVEAALGTLANITLYAVTANLTTQPLAAAQAGGAAGAAQYTTTLTATLSGGWAEVATPLASLPRIELAGLRADTAAQADASIVDGRARIQLSGLNLTFPYNLSLGTHQVPLQVALQGSLTLEGAVGCPSGCGAHGRCWQGASAGGANGTAAAAAPACECECGWTGPACDQPSGYCPRFLSSATTTSPAAAAPPAVTAPPAAPAAAQAPVPAEQLASCVSSADCNSNQEFDAASRTCVCLPGWAGADCQLCAAGVEGQAACAALPSKESSVCNRDFSFLAESRVKQYSCSLQPIGLESFLRPAFSVTCNTSVPAEPGSPAGQYCDLALGLAEGGTTVCRASLCTFQRGDTRAICGSMHCECAAPCPRFSTLNSSLEGRPITLGCDAATSVCSVVIDGFFIQSIPADCETAECLVEGYSLETGTWSVPEQNSYDPVIAAVPLAALVLVVAALAAAVLAHRHYFVAASEEQVWATGASGKGGAPAAAPMAGQQVGTIQELRFEGLWCWVSVPRQGWLHPPAWGPWRSVAEPPVVPTPTQTSKSTAPGTSDASLAALENGSAAAPLAGAGPAAPCDGSLKAVLRGVSGVAKRGELVGVLGPSGCGKSTLCALISGSPEYVGAGARFEGSVLLDGALLGRGGHSKVAFVPQDDTLPGSLTVEECIRCSALLRLPPGLDPAQVQAHTWRVIQELGLQEVASSRVGGELSRGISGGERRRVTIGCELVAAPSALVLDEPTSGLDSYAALQLMRTLKRVANVGRIVLLSFHQPSPAMFALLDRAYLLAGGACVLGGPPAGVAPALEAAGLPCPPGAATAEHMLEVASDPAQLAQLMKAGPRVEEAAAGALPPPHALLEVSGQAVAAKGVACASAPATPEPEAEQLARFEPDADVHRGRSLPRELSVLFWRTLAGIWRNPALLLLHWGLAIAAGLLAGVIFFQVNSDMSGIQNRGGGITCALAFLAFSSLTLTDVVLSERRLVAREVRGGCYRSASYLLVTAALDGLLLRAVPALLFCAPFYPMASWMGLQSGATHVAIFLLTMVTFALAAAALALAVAVGSGTAARANLLLVFLFLLSLLVGGFLVNVDTMPDWIGWLHYLSVFFYAYDITTTNEVESLRLDVTVEGLTAYENVAGRRVLSTFGIDADRMTDWIIVLSCLYPAVLLLAFVALWWRMPRARRGGGGGGGRLLHKAA